ncbi:MAG: BsuPI-related putative proteinase inhibitor [Bacillota bacterium]
MRQLLATTTVLLLALIMVGSGCSLPSLATPGWGRGQAGDFEVRFAAHPPNPAAGAGTEFTLELTNRGTSKVVLEFNTSQEFDLVIKSGSTTAWRWSGGMMFLQVITRKELAPGESLGYRVRWDGKDQDGKTLPAGTYMVSAEFKGKGVKVSIPQLQLVVQ